MTRRRCTCLLISLTVLAAAGCVSARPARMSWSSWSGSFQFAGDGSPPPGFGSVTGPTPDPLEPMNRVFFQVNDRVYFWVLKPVAQGWRWVVPRRGRRWVSNFTTHLATPVRLVNCALQGQFEGAGVELARFGVNTTIGVLGFGDPAAERWGMRRRNEDFGQTLGVYGIGPGFPIHWPLLGPSNLRDTVGLAGDLLLNIGTYVPGIGIIKRVNNTSFHIGEYEDFKRNALAPYVGLREAYLEQRRFLIKQRGPVPLTEESDRPPAPLGSISLTSPEAWYRTCRPAVQYR